MADAQPLSPSDPRSLGRYELLGRLGEGGQGVVFLAHAPADGALVAIKQLRALLSESEASRFRFLREVMAAKRVPPFCTAQMLDAALADAQPYIVSEYIPGPSLEAVVRSEGPRSGTALDRIAVNTATALAGIHQAGIVHRDFKASNVLLGPDGPVVIDFGIAKALDAVDSNLTLPGHVAGTPGYLAPDQFEEGVAGPAVDMFAWGATVAYAATGKLPFGSGPLPVVIYRILNEPPRLDGLTPQLHGLVAACLEKDPASRPTAREIVDHLLAQEHLGGAPALDAPQPRAGALSPWNATTGEAAWPAGEGDTQGPGAPLPPGPAPSAGGPPTMTVDPDRAAGLPQPQPQPQRSQSPDPGGPPVPATGKPREARRVPVRAAVTAVAAVAALAAGAAAVKALTGDSGGNHSSVRAAANTVPTDSAPGTTPASGPTRHGTTGAAGTRTRPPAGSPVSSQASATTTGGGQSPAQQSPGTSTPPAATSSPTAATSTSPAPAATPNPYTPAEVCGSSYYVIDSHALSGGTIYLLWSDSTSENCVTTMRTDISGKIQMDATLQVENGPSGSDSGSYTYYAGPVALSAAATCVEWGGAIGTSTWTSGWSHCS